MNALNLVFADDHVLECSTVGERENGVLVTALSLSSAADTTAIGLQATIEGASNHLRLLECLRALGRGNGNGGTLGKAGEAGGSVVGRACGSGGSESQDGSSDGSLHVDDVDGDWVMRLKCSESGSSWTSESVRQATEEKKKKR